MKLNDKDSEYNKKIYSLETKIKDLQERLGKHQSLSRKEIKTNHFHKKSEASVDIPESHKNMYYSFMDNSKNNVIFSK